MDPLALARLDDYLHDAERMAWFLATVDSARLIDREMHGARVFKGETPSARHDVEGRDVLLRFALGAAFDQAAFGRDALICEFGVHKGETITLLSAALASLRADRSGLGRSLPERLHGFDSFVGLPEDWFLGRKAGRFSLDGKMPQAPADVELYKGWFAETLPGFLAAHQGPAALIHADADLYSSTVTILDAFTREGRIVPGTVIVFDEFFNYPGWQQHEYKAFKEWVAREHVAFEYLGMTPCHYSAAIRVLGMGAR